MHGFIYKTINKINGHIYIGQTTQKGNHFKYYLGSGRLINKAIKKYGKKNFERELLVECSNQDHLNRMERFFIYYLKPYYNIDIGGTGIGKMKDETKKKLSDAHKGKKASLETREKMSKSRKGITHTEEWKRKIGEANSKKVRTEEQKKHIGDIQRGSRSHRARKIICVETKEIFDCI